MIRYRSFTLFAIIIAFTTLTPARAKVVNGDITFTRYDNEFKGLSLYTIHPDGTQLRRFVRGANGTEWSPDGSQFLYSDYEACDLAVKTLTLPGIKCLVNLPYNQELQGCSIAPDRSKIACVLSDVQEHKDRVTYRSSIVLVSPDHPQQIKTLVAKRLSVFYDPVWSQDNQTIFFESQPNVKSVKRERITFIGSLNQAGIFSVSATTPSPVKRLQRVPWVEPTGSSPAWSLDGKQFAYVYNVPPLTRANHKTEIRLISFEPTLQQRKLEIKGMPSAVLQLTFSPDGQYLAFTGKPNQHHDNELFVAKLDGSELRRLTHTAEYEIEPAWQPVSIPDL